MKTLKTILIITVFSLSILNVNAQDYEFAIDNAKKIYIDNLLGEIEMKNHDGNKLIIKSQGYDEVSEKAKGLKEIYGGEIDNTGIGLSVTKTENTIRVAGASKRSEDAEYTFLVPKNIMVKIDYTSPFANEDIVIKDFSNELEIESLTPDIELINITGPLTIHAISGEIKIVFTSLSQESPSSIAAISGDIEIVLPATTKADIEMRTINGGLYTDHDIEFNKEDKKDMKFIGGGGNIKGKMNGGGVELELSTISGSIYLRK